MIKDILLNAFFPPVCPVCRKRISAPDSLCPDCFSRLNFFQSNPEKQVSAVVYDDLSRQLVLALKYGDRPDLALMLARMMYNAGKDLLRDADVLTGVPLHWKRMMFRKYNQATVLAFGVSKLSGIPVEPVMLKRIKSTPKQSTRAQRFENVKGAFAVNPKITVAGKTIVLVDDVLTTGATTNACSRALLENGAREVKVLTFAKAQEAG